MFYGITILFFASIRVSPFNLVSIFFNQSKYTFSMFDVFAKDFYLARLSVDWKCILVNFIKHLSIKQVNEYCFIELFYRDSLSIFKYLFTDFFKLLSRKAVGHNVIVETGYPSVHNSFLKSNKVNNFIEYFKNIQSVHSLWRRSHTNLRTHKVVDNFLVGDRLTNMRFIHNNEIKVSFLKHLIPFFMMVIECLKRSKNHISFHNIVIFSISEKACSLNLVSTKNFFKLYTSLF